jgi:hypothetical protein
VKAAQATGYPVVLKALAPDVAHKNQMGFVIAGVRDEQEVREAYATLESRVTSNKIDRAKVSIILQPMMPAKAELIAGVSWEDPLGHFLVIGLGGIYTEVLDEAILLPIPVSSERIKARLSTSRTGHLVKVIGGENALEQVVHSLDALQRLVMTHEDKIRSIDVNPLLVGEKGCVAVDALIVPR